MRRKTGSLVPLELAICGAALALRERGVEPFHGYLIAKELKHASDAKLLTAYGTLYRALGRLEQMGLMTSTWEDPQIPADANRPRRRLYAITQDGQTAVINAARETGPAPLATPRASES
ncbi:MAG TPA: PadR family transcriptional regulator [Vicinamibacterales bacterium]|nr:PadR family transcriptional regulator [Vicinamibacterales bacterium]